MKNETVINTCAVIDNNIAKLKDDVGLLSQNILGQCRNLCEAVIHMLYSEKEEFDQYDFNDKRRSIKNNKIQGKHRFLFEFHKLLEKSVSHYTEDSDNSGRLMLKYHEYLIKIKNVIKEDFGLNLLDNLEMIPTINDEQISKYYSVIAEKINITQNSKLDNRMGLDRYYVLRKKPFFIGSQIYYELTIVKAFDNNSKQDRIIAFTKKDILENYSIRICTEKVTIEILGVLVDILVIRDWKVAIRVCEINNFSKIFNEKTNITETSYEYKKIMETLTLKSVSLVDLIYYDDDSFEQLRLDILKNARNPQIIFILEKSREIILKEKSGKNIILYLLLKMNNIIIKKQTYSKPNKELSNLYLNYGCIPFEQMPFATSLIYHNPNILDLFSIFDVKGRECELMARKIKNNSEQKDTLFTSLSELSNFENILDLVEKYNSKLYMPKHKGRQIKTYKDHLYILENVSSTLEIIEEIVEMSKRAIPGYSESVKYWLKNENHKVDCVEKKNSMEAMFDNSNVALIYGAAGTGKTTLISNISDFFDEYQKIYLTNTNAAKSNLENRVKSKNTDFKTINNFLRNNKEAKDTILFVDESSTVRNRDMKKILQMSKYLLLVLVGDVYQIESINFGNWFSVIKDFVDPDSITELTKPYRSTNHKLIKSWNKVRSISKDIVEDFVQNNYSSELNTSIFNYEQDQIILCLNYDGLYGINNVNRILQANNSNKYVEWDDNIYKVGDPILFNDSGRFHPLLYNNLKGEILEINKTESEIYFKVKVNKVVNQMDTYYFGLTFHEIVCESQTIISFKILESKGYSDEEMGYECIIPFQVSYAVSIHKAQGLEYNNVKIVITNEIEELITHNIFYTAITRAKENLKIYWSPKTERNILEGLTRKNIRKDSELLKTMLKK